MTALVMWDERHRSELCIDDLGAGRVPAGLSTAMIVSPVVVVVVAEIGLDHRAAAHARRAGHTASPPRPSISGVAPATTSRWTSFRCARTTSKNRARPSLPTSRFSRCDAPCNLLRILKHWKSAVGAAEPSLLAPGLPALRRAGSSRMCRSASGAGGAGGGCRERGPSPAGSPTIFSARACGGRPETA